MAWIPKGKPQRLPEMYELPDEDVLKLAAAHERLRLAEDEDKLETAAEKAGEKMADGSAPLSIRQEAALAASIATGVDLTGIAAQKEVQSRAVKKVFGGKDKAKAGKIVGAGASSASAMGDERKGPVAGKGGKSNKGGAAAAAAAADEEDSEASGEDLSDSDPITKEKDLMKALRMDDYDDDEDDDDDEGASAARRFLSGSSLVAF